MSLIKCPECGNQYSDTSDLCPHCGYIVYIDEHYAEGIASIITGIVAWIISLLFGGFFFSFLSLILFIFSLILENKCTRKFSFIGFAISSLGILFLILKIIV